MTPQDFLPAAQASLDREGYGFQYAVIAAAQRTFQRSPWRLPVTEFPVQVNGTNTRIDLLLQHWQRGWFLVAECKRVNPRLASWLFLRAPFLEASHLANYAFCEYLTRPDDGGEPVTRIHSLFHTENAYHLALEVRTNTKGDPTGPGRGAIEEASTQVLRGMNGFAEFLRHQPRTTPTCLIPVIFTTASLWVTQADLSQADLATGALDLAAAGAQPAKWVFYHYHQSPALRHSLPVVPPDTGGDPLTRALYTEFVRPIAIVNAYAIEDFLRMSCWQ